MHDHFLRLCFIVCDAGPAGHFAEFSQYLITDERLCIDIYVNEAIQEKFQDFDDSERLRVFTFSLNADENNLARNILENCVKDGVQIMIVDIAHRFDLKLREVFDLSLLSIDFWCYYDNPESFVPGGYSIRADEMMKLSKKILFANRNLARMDWKIGSGIGFYPIEIAARLKQRREIECDLLREKYGWENIPYIMIYFGGNNQVYYEKAFPHFLSLLAQLSHQSSADILFLLHQHPAAKQKNFDAHLFQQCLEGNSHIQGEISPLTSDEAQIVADSILYYQTSMAPQFALVGLPIMQVGHEIYQDILVRHNLCQIARDFDQFSDALEILKKQKKVDKSSDSEQLIYDTIGYDQNWLKNFRNMVLNFE